MNGMTVLVSPLSWGFGHAGRMIPVALELKRRGCIVIFAADSSLLEIAGRELPGIRLLEIPGLRIRYSRRLPQYICIVLQLPRIIASGFREHRILKRLVRELNPSLIISDNRFGFYNRKVYSVYVTHQLRIPFPRFLRFLETPAAWLHRLIINRYDLCLVPDYPGGVNLSGRLSHGIRLPRNIICMGPVSRFAGDNDCEVSASGAASGSEISVSAGLSGTSNPPKHPDMEGSAGLSGTSNPPKHPDMEGSAGLSGTCYLPSHPDKEESAGLSGNPYTCLILSGPEPQRTLLLEKTADALRETEIVILSTGPAPHGFAERYPSATFITAPANETMRSIIAASSLVIARAGYTTVMELFMMGRGAVIIPTPGQTEQEYLGKHLDGKYGFITLQQDKLEQLKEIVEGTKAGIAEFAGHSSGVTGLAAGIAEFAGHSSGVSGLAAGTRVAAHSADAVAGCGSSDAETGPDSDSSFAKALFEKAMDCLLEQNKK